MARDEMNTKKFVADDGHEVLTVDSQINSIR